MTPAEDPRLGRVSAICAGLPEADRERSGRHATFRVRGRTFAHYLDDHHGDGIVGVVGRAPPGQGEGMVAVDPERYSRVRASITWSSQRPAISR